MADPPRGRIFDPRLSNINKDVLQGRHDQPVSVTSPALEWAVIQTSALTSPGGRGLYGWELDVIQDIFQGGVDASRIRVVETRILNAPTTLAGQIRVPHGWNFDGDNKPVLVHEVTHVWQYQTRGTSYITDSVYHNASGQIATGNRNVAYMNYQLQPDSNLTDFTAEEQATIVADYYEMTRIHQNDAVPLPWIVLRRRDLPIYERLIQQVRSARPRPDAAIYQDSLMNQPHPGFETSAPGPAGTQAPAVMPLLQIRFRGL